MVTYFSVIGNNSNSRNESRRKLDVLASGSVGSLEWRCRGYTFPRGTAQSALTPLGSSI